MSATIKIEDQQLVFSKGEWQGPDELVARATAASEKFDPFVFPLNWDAAVAEFVAKELGGDVVSADPVEIPKGTIV